MTLQGKAAALQGQAAAAQGQAAQPSPTRALIPAIAAALAALLLIGAHLLALAHGPSWTSPLLLGDHLFDLALALAVLLYSLAIGRKAFRPLLDRRGDPLTEALVAIALGMGTLSTGLLALGLLHLYYPLTILLAGIALGMWLRTELLAALLSTADAIARWYHAGLPTAPTRAQRLVLLVLVCAFAATLLDAMLPAGWGSPAEWDALSYHLAAPKIYLAAHRFLPLPAIDRANQPSGQEMLYTLGLLLGSDGMGKVLSTLSFPLLGIATFALGRCHWGSQVGWLALFLLGNVIWLGVEAPTTFPDFASFFVLVLSVSDALRWLDRLDRRIPSPTPTLSSMLYRLRGPDRVLVRAGLLMGVANSFKLVNLPGIPALCLTVGLIALCRGPLPLARRLALSLWAGSIAGIAALLPLLPWVLKDEYYFHTIFGVPLAANTATAGSIAVSAAAQHTLAGHLSWIVANMADVAWTSISPLCLLLPLAPLLLRRPVDQGLIAFLLIAAVFWLIFVPRYIEPRYYVGPIAIGEVLLAALLWRLLRALPLSATLIEVPLMAYLLLHSGLALGVTAHQALSNHAPEILLGRISRDAYLAGRVRPFRAESWANHALPAEAAIAMVGVTRGYYLNHPYLPEWYNARLNRLGAGPLAQRAEWRNLCQAGVRYLILSRADDTLDGSPPTPPLAAFTWINTSGLEPRVLYSANGVDVIAIRPCGTGGALG